MKKTRTKSKGRVVVIAVTVLIVMVSLGITSLMGTKANDVQKKIILTFDDAAQARSDDWGVEIMAEFDYQGVLFPPVICFDWRDDQIFFDLIEQGWELGCHSWTHIKLTPVHDQDILNHEIIDAKHWLENHFNITVISFAYPYSMGSDDPDILRTLEEGGYLYAREGAWHRDWNGSRSFQLNSWVQGGDKWEYYLNRLFMDVEENGIAVAMFHRVNTNQTGYNALSPDQFRHILGEIQSRGYEVVTFKGLEDPLPQVPMEMTLEDWETFWEYLRGISTFDIRSWLDESLAEWKETRTSGEKTQ